MQMNKYSDGLRIKNDKFDRVSLRFKLERYFNNAIGLALFTSEMQDILLSVADTNSNNREMRMITLKQVFMANSLSQCRQ